MFKLTPQLAAAASRRRALDGTLVAAAREVSVTIDEGDLEVGLLVTRNGCRCANGAALPDDLARWAMRGRVHGLYILAEKLPDQFEGPERGTVEYDQLEALMDAHDHWAVCSMNTVESGKISILWPDLVGRAYDRALFLEICDRLDPDGAAATSV